MFMPAAAHKKGTAVASATTTVWLLLPCPAPPLPPLQPPWPPPPPLPLRLPVFANMAETRSGMKKVCKGGRVGRQVGGQESRQAG